MSSSSSKIRWYTVAGFHPCALWETHYFIVLVFLLLFFPECRWVSLHSCECFSSPLSPHLESLTQLAEGAPEKMERHLSQPLCTLTPSPDQVQLRQSYIQQVLVPILR